MPQCPRMCLYQLRQVLSVLIDLERHVNAHLPAMPYQITVITWYQPKSHKCSFIHRSAISASSLNILCTLTLVLRNPLTFWRSAPLRFSSRKEQSIFVRVRKIRLDEILLDQRNYNVDFYMSIGKT